MESLTSFLKKIHPVEEATLEAYATQWKPYDAPKRHIMTAPGETEKYLYFVKQGVQKSYFQHREKEHIIAFAYAPSFSGIPESFFTQAPSRYYLETITPGEFLRISYEQHQAFMKEHRAIETLFRKVLELFLDGVIQRQHEIMALNMEERFTGKISLLRKTGRAKVVFPASGKRAYHRLCLCAFV
jgi:CRP-like cAMP-binding protein